MRLISFPARTTCRYRLGASLLIVAILQSGSLPALAQTRDYALPGGQDYYAPRTTQDEITTLHNVQLYHLGPGKEAVAKGRWDVALKEFEFILRYYPNHPVVLSLVSDLCLKWVAPACDAKGWFQKAIERNPNAAPTYILHGVYLHRSKRINEAVREYRRAIELAPGYADAHYNLGIALADLKQYELANQHAQKSYELGATLPGLRVRLEKLGKWNPDVRLPASDAAPAGQPASER